MHNIHVLSCIAIASLHHCACTHHMICKGTLKCVELYCVAVHTNVGQLSCLESIYIAVCILNYTEAVYYHNIIIMNFIDYC